MNSKLEKFFQTSTQESMMRLMSLRTTNTALFIAIFSIVGVISSILLSIIFNRNLDVLSGVIGAILGGTAALVGSLLITAFGGKAAQSFAENMNKKEEDEEKKEN